MNIWETLRETWRQDHRLEKGTDLFFISMQEGGEIARKSLEVLITPDGKPIEIAPTDLGGITIEVASLHALNDKKIKDGNREVIISDLQTVRTYFWSLLVNGMRNEERTKLQIPANSSAYIDHAHNAALKILRTREQEKAYRERRLRAELPVHVNVMQGIRLGKISF